MEASGGGNKAPRPCTRRVLPRPDLGQNQTWAARCCREPSLPRASHQHAHYAELLPRSNKGVSPTTGPPLMSG